MKLDLQFFKQQVRNIVQAFAGVTKTNSDRREILVKWEFPPLDWIKLNTDGTSKGSSNLASCGGILRDSTGRWLKGFTANLGSATATEAEIWVSTMDCLWRGTKDIEELLSHVTHKPPCNSYSPTFNSVTHLRHWFYGAKTCWVEIGLYEWNTHSERGIE